MFKKKKTLKTRQTDVFTKVSVIIVCLRIKKLNFCFITTLVTVTKWSDVASVTTLNN